MRFSAALLLFLSVSVVVRAQDCSLLISHPSGWYDAPVSVTMMPSLGCAGAVQIRYTLNSDTPDAGSPQYENALLLEDVSGRPDRFTSIRTTIPDESSFLDRFMPPESDVHKAVILRAAVFSDTLRVTPVYTLSYFFAEEPRYGYPVFSVVTDSVNLFSTQTGIYVPGDLYDGSNFKTANFAQTGVEWERPAHVTMLNAEGGLNFSMDAGIRLHGGFTRRAARKSLRFYARTEYSQNRFPWPLLENRSIGEYRRFILRNSGQQVYASLFLDAYNQRLLRGTDFTYTESSPALLYLNGEYWGIHNIREFQDEHFLESLHFADRDQIDFLENYLEVRSGTSLHYEQLLQFVADNDFTSETAWQQVNTMMDTDNYIDYLIYQMFIANVDWPGFNIRYWRKQTSSYQPDASYGHDGRWRWVIHDTDGGVGNATSWTTNMYTVMNEPDGPSWPNPPWSTLKFRKFSENADFRREFVNRVADFMNTVFQPGFMQAELDSFIAVYRPELPDHINRWQRPASIADWEASIVPVQNFITRRQSVFLEHTSANFDISGEMFTLTVTNNEPEKGLVYVNRIPLRASYPGISEEVYPWSGQYFTDHPVRLQVDPADGYRVSGWLTSAGYQAGEELVITSGSAFTAEPVFETVELIDPRFPDPMVLASDDFSFTSWSQDEPEGRFPPSMVFLQSERSDPGLEDPADVPYHIPYNSMDDNEYHANDLGSVGFPYRLTGRTRINGLGNDGISMINTGRGRDLGAVVAAIDTRGVEDIRVSFTAGTVIPNSRTYNLRLQLRTDRNAVWQDLLDSQGEPIEYQRNAVAGHSRQFSQIALPDSVEGRPYVQLRWKYYHTGERLSAESGSRDMLRLDDIIITASTLVSVADEDNRPRQVQLDQNFPNPFNPVTTLRYRINESSAVRLEVFSITGQRVAVLVDDVRGAGEYTALFNASALASGVYIYRLITPGQTITRKMTLIK